MLLSNVKEILNAKILTDNPEEKLKSLDIHTACGRDLMSDVLAFVKDQSLLLTGLINPQVVRTAEMMDIVAICFVRGKTPPSGVVELADELGIVILSTNLPMFAACGRLYSQGLEGRKDAETL